MPKQFRHACRFLECGEKIAGYLAAVEHNARILREIRNILPTPLDEHCLHASLEAGVLTLITDSPVWSSRLRFFAPELERDLAPSRGRISTIHIRVRPCMIAPTSSPKHKLSKRAAEHLMAAAAEIGDDQIAAALRRLAKTGQDR